MSLVTTVLVNAMEKKGIKAVWDDYSKNTFTTKPIDVKHADLRGEYLICDDQCANWSSIMRGRQTQCVNLCLANYLDQLIIATSHDVKK